MIHNIYMHIELLMKTSALMFFHISMQRGGVTDCAFVKIYSCEIYLCNFILFQYR